MTAPYIITPRTIEARLRAPRPPYRFDPSHWHFRPPAAYDDDDAGPQALKGLVLPHASGVVDYAPDPMLPLGQYTRSSDAGGGPAEFRIVSGRPAVYCEDSGDCINFDTSYTLASVSSCTISALVHFPVQGSLSGIMGSADFRLNNSTACEFLGVSITTQDQSALSGWHRVTGVGKHESGAGGERYEVYFDGLLEGSSTGNGRFPSVVTIDGLGNMNIDSNRDRGTTFADFWVWDGRFLTADAIYEHAQDPYAGIEEYGRRSYFLPAAGGATTYDETIAETFSFVDSDSRTATFARTLAEALSLVDASSYTATFARSLAESLAFTDTASGSTAFEETVAESLALTDAASVAVTHARTISEALSLVDAATRSAVFARQINEALTLIDSASGAGGTEISATVGGQSMTLAQMRRLERQQLLAMLRQDDEVIVALVADILRKGRRLN